MNDEIAEMVKVLFNNLPYLMLVQLRLARRCWQCRRDEGMREIAGKDPGSGWVTWLSWTE